MSDSDKIYEKLSSEEKPTEELCDSSILISDETHSDLKVKFLYAKNEKLKEEIEGLKQDRLQRKVFGYIIFGFMCLYMLAVLGLVYLQGFEKVHLEDNVLIALLTTSLASVIGVFNFVAKYLFPNKK